MFLFFPNYTTIHSIFHKPVFSRHCLCLFSLALNIVHFLFFIINSPPHRFIYRCTVTIVSCTIYPQGDKCCADVLSLIRLSSHHHLQYVTHRPLPSHLALFLNSPLLPQPSPVSSYCLVYPVSLFTSTQQFSYLSKLPFAFFIAPRRLQLTALHLLLLVFILALCGIVHPQQSWASHYLILLPLHL